MTETGLHIPVAEINAALAAVRRQAEPVAKLTLTLAGEGLVSEMQFSAPIKTGVLKDSHGVTSFGRNSDGTFANARSITLYANTDYALARHERWPDKPGYRWAAKVMAEKTAPILTEALREAVRRSQTGGVQ